MKSTGPALIFDYDGVLADTEPLIWGAWRPILENVGASLGWEEYCRIGRGAKDDEMLRRIPRLRDDPALLAELTSQIESVQQTVIARVAEHPPIPKTTVAMLQSLGDYRVGLVTSSRRGEVEPVLLAAGVLDCFCAMVFAEDTVCHKPDPEPYILACRRLGVAGGMAFEDSEPGLASARAAGLTAIRVDDPQRLSAIVAASLVHPPA
jgi:beta-phosphoglucomutase